MSSARHAAASHQSWANTPDRTARLKTAHDASPASVDYWVRKLDPERFADATDEQKHQAAMSARKAHYAMLAAKSVKARKRATP